MAQLIPDGVGTVVTDAIAPELLDVSASGTVTGAATYVGIPGYVRIEVLVENESTVTGVLTITGGSASGTPAEKSFGDIPITANGTFYIEAYVDTEWAQADFTASAGTADIQVTVVEDHLHRAISDSAAE